MLLNYDFEDRVIGPDRRPKRARCDVAVVGSGAGGATVARELSAAGLDVIILEEGPYRSARHYGDSTPLESVQQLYRNNGMTFTIGNQSILLPQGRCVGGCTVINSGTALRATGDAIARWRDWGLERFVADLERYYRYLEHGLNVIPARVPGKNSMIFQRGAEKLGWKGGPLTRFERDCRGAGRCFLGCPNDAKQAMNVSFVPDALRAGARIFVQTRAKRILAEGGRVTGLEGDGVTIECDTVVVAAGAVYTPLLLRTVLHNPHLGKNLQLHPASRVVALFDEEVRGWTGAPQAYHVDEFLHEGISLEGIFVPPAIMGPTLPLVEESLRSTMARYENLAMIGFRIIERSRGRVLPRVFGLPRSWPLVWMWVERDDAMKLKRATALAAQLMFEAGARKVFTPVRGFEVLESKRDLDRLFEAPVRAGDLEMSAYHVQGTARMAVDESRGVVAPTGETFAVRNLYVADASVMPSTPVHNPQLSIMAFALSVAESVLSKYHRPSRIGKEVGSHTPLR